MFIWMPHTGPATQTLAFLRAFITEATPTVQATEEAAVNAMVAADTMTGIDTTPSSALPHDKLREVLKKYKQMEKSAQTRASR